MNTTLLQIVEPFIIFFVSAMSSAFLIILMPSFIGKKMLPTYTTSKKEQINMTRENLYEILINYRQYSNWKTSVKKAEQNLNNDGQTTWTEYYKFSRVKNIFIENKKIENKLLIYSTTNREYAAVYSFEIDAKDEEHSILEVKETIHLTAPYLRFFYSFLFYKKRFVNKTFRLIKKYQLKQN